MHDAGSIPGTGGTPSQQVNKRQSRSDFLQIIATNFLRLLAMVNLCVCNGLKCARYSEKSDVWAYGVTAFELLSAGDDAYELL